MLKICGAAELSFSFGEKAKWYSHPGGQQGSFLQRYIWYMIQQLCSLVFIQSSKKLTPTQNLHMNDYSGFIHSSPNLEITKMSFSRWMDKQIVVHPDKILFKTKKNLVIKPQKDIQKT